MLHSPASSLNPRHISRIGRSYYIHNIPVNVFSNSDEVLRIFDNFWGYFLIDAVSSAPSFTFWFDVITPDMSVRFSDIDNWILYATVPPVTSYARGSSFRYQYKNKGIFIIDFRQRTGHGYMMMPYSSQELRQMCRNVLFSSIFHILRTEGIFLFHASAVAFEQHGIAVAGASGHGKTTLLLHLLQEGFDYMSDDIVLLQTTQQTLTLLAFPAPIRISADTLRFFPDLAGLVKDIHLDERGKYQIDAHNLCHSRPVDSAAPALLLLPEITTNPCTTLEPIPRTEAAVQCIPENTVLEDTIDMSRENFNILAQFIRDIQCYKVHLGQNMHAVGQGIRDIVSDV